MKTLLALSVLSLSLSAVAADMDKYCLPFLNGQMESQGAVVKEGKLVSPGKKPEIMEGFVAEKVKLKVAGNMVDTIQLKSTDPDIMSDADKKTSSYPWGEEEVFKIMKYKKNGKKTTDYKLIVKRDKSGNLISIAKKPVLLQDFDLTSDTLYFKPQKETCVPSTFIKDSKLAFSVDLCREIDRFLVENPSAKECLVARHDQKLAALVREHAKNLPEKIVLDIEKKSEDMSALYAAKHRVDCSQAGLDPILQDGSIWGNYIGKRGEEKVKGADGDAE